MPCTYSPRTPEETARSLRKWRAEAEARAKGEYVSAEHVAIGDLLEIPTGDGWQRLRVDGLATEQELWAEMDVPDPCETYPQRAKEILRTLGRVWARVTYVEVDGTPVRWSDGEIRTDIVYEARRVPPGCESYEGPSCNLCDGGWARLRSPTQYPHHICIWPSGGYCEMGTNAICASEEAAE